jgi:hypothetical protein
MICDSGNRIENFLCCFADSRNTAHFATVRRLPNRDWLHATTWWLPRAHCYMKVCTICTTDIVNNPSCVCYRTRQKQDECSSLRMLLNLRSLITRCKSMICESAVMNRAFRLVICPNAMSRGLPRGWSLTEIGRHR